MHYGLFCLFERFMGSQKEAIDDQLKLVALADALRFDHVWFGEHHFNNFSLCPSPTLLLSYAIAITQRVRLGCAGFLAPFYDPIRLAEEIAMLDILSKGRLNLGFAKGAFAPDAKHFDVTIQNLRPKMFECVSAIERLLNDLSPTTFKGIFVDFEATNIQPKPIQEDIPTYIATFSSLETVIFAAQKGFGLMFSQGATLEECAYACEAYEALAGVKPRVILLRTLCIDPDHEQALAFARPALDHFAKSMRAASSFGVAPRFDPQKYQSLITQRDVFFDGEKMFHCGIIGNEEACIAKLRNIKEHLENVTVVFKPLGTNFLTNSTFLRRFNDDVRPYC
ncbi:MAG: LLM class flavin-dependent oxidoreductase [Campylobacterales bacterium]|nr:LLM class flavin-dependent oxidoreductase [Campylobacterales bacterium]